MSFLIAYNRNLYTRHDITLRKDMIPVLDLNDMALEEQIEAINKFLEKDDTFL